MDSKIDQKGRQKVDPGGKIGQKGRQKVDPDGKSGQRKAGEVTFGKKKLEDPTRKLEEEILGK